MKANRYPIVTAFASFTLTVLGATIFEVGGILAGRTAVLLQGIYSNLPWVFLIYPLMLTVRGDINGILTAKLGTNLHLGNIKPTWRKNTPLFHKLVLSVLLLSIFDAIFVGVISFVFGLIFNIQVKFLQMIVISITTFALASVVSIFITLSLAFIFFNKKIDPDVYILPITAMINDILITLIFFAVCVFYRPWVTNLYLFVGLPFSITIIFVVFFLLFKFRKDPFFKQTFIQSLPTLLLTAIIAAGAGTILTKFSMVIAKRPVLLVVYPAVRSLVGDQAAIFGNTTTTKLHLGAIKAKFSSLLSQDFLIPLASLITSGIIINCIYTIIGTAIAPEKQWGVSLFFLLLLVLILTNLSAFTSVGILAMFSAVLTYKLGLDPDNMITPFLTSIADLISTVLLVNIALIFYI
ncbi:MAG: magnesium transporter [Candidatus Heimdallarchaeaceae archaeon]